MAGLLEESLTAGGDRTRLQSFHEQSISVMNSMMLSGSWRREEEEEEEGEGGHGTMLGGSFFTGIVNIRNRLVD